MSDIMKRMQEDEFDKLEKMRKPCLKGRHKMVKLYYLGTHSDCGCEKCGMKSYNIEDF